MASRPDAAPALAQARNPPPGTVRAHGPTCPVCGSPAAEFQFAKKGFPIMRCAACDVAFHTAALTVNELHTLYSESYFTAGGFEGYPDYLGDEPAHRRQARYYLARLRRHGIRPGRVLDVGCAAGFFLDEARRQGWTGMGCDISEYATQHARDVLGLEVIAGNFLELPLPSESFDLITMFSVLAHVPDPPAVAERLHALLKPGGHLLIETSNRDALVPRLLGPRWHLCSPPSVICYYNRGSLQHLFPERDWRMIHFAPSIKWISLEHGFSRVQGRLRGWLFHGFQALRNSMLADVIVPYVLGDIALVGLQKRSSAGVFTDPARQSPPPDGAGSRPGRS